MATPVSNAVLNLSASSAAAANARNASGAPDIRFSDHLARAQTQSPPREPTREPTRESTRTDRQDTPPAGPHTAPRTQDARPSQDAASAETPIKPKETAAMNPSAAPTPTDAPEAAAQAALAAGAVRISEELPAMIAALLGQIADTHTDIDKALDGNEDGAIDYQLRANIIALLAANTGEAPADDSLAPEGEIRLETSTKDTLAGRSRHPAPGELPHTAAKPTLEAPATPAAAATASANIQAARGDILAPLVDKNAQGTHTNASAPQPHASPLLNINAPRLPIQPNAPQFTLPAGAGQAAWAEEVGNRVMWMLGRAESRAELILTPPHLGKVEVSINLHGDQSTAQFVASSQAARDALEQAMPRLRELLAQAGINLGEASVDTSSAEGQTQDGTPSHPSHGLTGDPDRAQADATAVTAANWVKLDNGLVNTFA